MATTESKKSPSPEEIKAFCKEASDKLSTHLKEGMKVTSEIAHIVHRNVLTAQKELLEHHIGRLESHLKKLDAQLDEAEAPRAAKKR